MWPARSLSATRSPGATERTLRKNTWASRPTTSSVPSPTSRTTSCPSPLIALPLCVLQPVRLPDLGVFLPYVRGAQQQKHHPLGSLSGRKIPGEGIEGQRDVKAGITSRANQRSCSLNSFG